MADAISAAGASKPANKNVGRKDAHKKDKPTISKAERRAKYTQLARERENRKRRQMQSSNLVCYQCRQKGHAVIDCPNNGSQTSGASKRKSPGAAASSSSSRVCFKCGSTEHSLSKCPKRNDGDANDLPFCHCFICNKKGHLSSKCPENENGIFVNGGECKTCGSKYHTSKNCPMKDDAKKQKKERSVTGEPEIDPSSLLEGEGDEMPDLDIVRPKGNTEKEEKINKKMPQATKRRVVHF